MNMMQQFAKACDYHGALLENRTRMKMPTFDAQSHSYRIDDKRIPSVTEVLRLAGLVDTTGYTTQARDRGRAVHTAIDLQTEGTLDTASLDARIAPYLAAHNHFLALSGATIVHHERRVYSPTFGFAGTLDEYVFLNGRPALIDVKTGSIPPWVGAQLAAYLVAGIECRVLSPRSKRFALELRPDGTFRLVEQTGNDWPVFLAALKTVQEMKRGDDGTANQGR